MSGRSASGARKNQPARHDLLRTQPSQSSSGKLTSDGQVLGRSAAGHLGGGCGAATVSGGLVQTVKLVVFGSPRVALRLCENSRPGHLALERIGVVAHPERSINVLMRRERGCEGQYREKCSALSPGARAGEIGRSNEHRMLSQSSEAVATRNAAVATRGRPYVVVRHDSVCDGGAHRQNERLNSEISFRSIYWLVAPKNTH